MPFSSFNFRNRNDINNYLKSFFSKNRVLFLDVEKRNSFINFNIDHIVILQRRKFRLTEYRNKHNINRNINNFDFVLNYSHNLLYQINLLCLLKK